MIKLSLLSLPIEQSFRELNIFINMQITVLILENIIRCDIVFFFFYHQFNLIRESVQKLSRFSPHRNNISTSDIDL
jgi:hypothetical protein